MCVRHQPCLAVFAVSHGPGLRLHTQLQQSLNTHVLVVAQRRQQNLSWTYVEGGIVSQQSLALSEPLSQT